MTENTQLVEQPERKIGPVQQVKLLLNEDTVKKRFTDVLGKKAPQFMASIVNVVCSPVLQALIIFQMQLYGSASAEPFFAAPFSGEQGSTTAHLRRLPRKGRAGGAFKSLLKHRVLKQKAWVCVYSANFL